MDYRAHLRSDVDGDYVPWNADFNMEFSFEVDLRAAEAVLPRGLAAVEALPGRALLGVGYLRFPPGNPIGDELVHELATVVQVYPDMRDRRIARAGYYVVNIASTSGRFLDWANEVDRMPVHRSSGVRFDAEPERWRVAVADDDGPICTLANSHPQPSFKAGQAFFQAFTLQDGVCKRGLVSWSGVRCEHQRRSVESRLHPHPFFRGIDVSSARPHMQIFTRPGQTVEQRFYLGHAVIGEPG
jgi:hypothetical protein